ncbi:hypothetical protein JW948_03135 [bacterium]|nr:hypothetical protein [bacterium]
MSPVILSQLQAVNVKKGETAEFRIGVFTVPGADIQWFRVSKPFKGKNRSVLTVQDARKKTAGDYTALVQNSAGKVMSREVRFVIE